jgi:hypothetical protein
LKKAKGKLLPKTFSFLPLRAGEKREERSRDQFGFLSHLFVVVDVDVSAGSAGAGDATGAAAAAE